MFVLNPSPSNNESENLSSDGSSMVDNRFGGKRQLVNSTVYKNAADYTSKAGGNSGAVLNPVESVSKDIDKLNDSFSFKSDTKRHSDLNKRATTTGSSFIITLLQEDLLSEETSKSSWSHSVINIAASYESDGLSLDELIYTSWDIPIYSFWDSPM